MVLVLVSVALGLVLVFVFSMFWSGVAWWCYVKW